MTHGLSPERLAELEEQRRNTPEAIDAELRELSDQRIADLVEDAPPASKLWQAMTREERRAWRALNEQARRRHVATLTAAQEAKTAADEAKRQAAGEAERAEVRAKLQAAAPGLRGAALDAAVDQVLTQQAIASMDRALAEKRRQLGL